MTELPIPIVVALLLVVLAVSNQQQLRASASGSVFSLAIYAQAISMVFIGLRWSMDEIWLLRPASFFAVASILLLFFAFRSLGRLPVFVASADWPHTLPIIAVTLSGLLNPGLTDPLLVIVKLFYAWLLFDLVRRSPDSVQLTRLDWLRNVEAALWVAISFLLLSCAVDIAIAIDFMWFNGQVAKPLVAAVNLISVVLLGWVAMQIGRGPVDDADNSEPQTTTESSNSSGETDAVADAALLDTLNDLLITQQLYADSDLNLQKLARKAGVPARAISRVINSQHGKNISQWVNDARIDAACTRLTDKRVTVTEAMLDAGFITKSNFNREFRRVTGSSPSEWRKHNARHRDQT